MIHLIFNKDIFKILFLFSVSPGSRFDRKYIKEKVLMNNVPLDNALNALLVANIIKKEKRLYSINFDNPFAKNALSMASHEYNSLKQIPLNVFFLILDFISSIANAKIEAYLFGSYSKLIYHDKSDIDLAILGKGFDKSMFNKIAQKLEKKYNKKLELHFFDKSEFYSNKKDPLVKDIIKNGVRLI